MEFGWGTWIRTKAARVRAGSSTAKLSPKRPVAGRRQLACGQPGAATVRPRGLPGRPRRRRWRESPIREWKPADGRAAARRRRAAQARPRPVAGRPSPRSTSAPITAACWWPRPPASGFRVLDSFSRIVRLGEGLHATGRLSAAAMDRAIAALHACAARLARRPVRADPRDRHRGLPPRRQRRRVPRPGAAPRPGSRFDIISTREEAELALESCAPLLRGGGRRALLFDIGGGSTELAWVRLAGDGRPRTRSATTRCRSASSPWPSASAPPASPQDGFEAMVDDVAARLARLRGGPLHRPRDPRRAASGCSAPAAPSPPWPGVALNLPRYRRPLVDGTVLTARGRAQRAGRPARARPRRTGAAPLRRAGPGRVRAARLRGLRRDPRGSGRRRRSSSPTAACARACCCA